MKSTNEQLEQRGFIAEDQSVDLNTSITELVLMLKSKFAATRTAAVRIIKLKDHSSMIPDLITVLKSEKALYTKIEIQKALVSFGCKSIPFLIEQLGCIGKNQHTIIANADLNKKSFPLARDIAARILCQIGTAALQSLQVVLKSGSYKQKLEAIDAVGHISFNYSNSDCEKDLIELYNSANSDELLKWKIIKAMQAFKSNRVREILMRVIDGGENVIIINEAKRSLQRVDRS